MTKFYRFLLGVTVLVALSSSLLAQKLVYKKLYHHLDLEKQARDFTKKFIGQIFEARGGNVQFYTNEIYPKINFSTYTNQVTKLLATYYTEAEALKILTDNNIPLNSPFSLNKKVTRYTSKLAANKAIYEAAKKFGASLVPRMEKALDNNLIEPDGNYSSFEGITNQKLTNNKAWYLNDSNGQQIALVFTPLMWDEIEKDIDLEVRGFALREFTSDWYTVTKKDGKKVKRRDWKRVSPPYPMRKIQARYFENKIWTTIFSSYNGERCFRYQYYSSPSRGSFKLPELLHVTKCISKEDLKNSPILYKNLEDHIQKRIEAVRRNRNEDLDLYVFEKSWKEKIKYYLSQTQQPFSKIKFAEYQKKVYPNTYYTKKWKYIITEKMGVIEILNSKEIFDYATPGKQKQLLINWSNKNLKNAVLSEKPYKGKVRNISGCFTRISEKECPPIEGYKTFFNFEKCQCDKKTILQVKIDQSNIDLVRLENLSVKLNSNSQLKDQIGELKTYVNYLQSYMANSQKDYYVNNIKYDVKARKMIAHDLLQTTIIMSKLPRNRDPYQAASYSFKKFFAPRIGNYKLTDSEVSKLYKEFKKYEESHDFIENLNYQKAKEQYEKELFLKEKR